jgi:hypothetical protein
MKISPDDAMGYGEYEWVKRKDLSLEWNYAAEPRREVTAVERQAAWLTKFFKQIIPLGIGAQ